MASRLIRHPVDGEESYFISMTDLMVGLLFIFIIMLMVFALQYREAERKNLEAEQVRKMTTERLVDADQVRDEILESLRKYLLKHGLVVDIVKTKAYCDWAKRFYLQKAVQILTTTKR